MKRIPFAPLLCASLLAGSRIRAEASSGPDWLFPGEYESHQAMWMLWPTFENKAGFPSTEPMSRHDPRHERSRPGEPRACRTPTTRRPRGAC